jgi:hypothetical protein
MLIPPKTADLSRRLRRAPSSYRFKRFRTAVSPSTLALHAGRRLRGERLVVVLGSGHGVGSTWLTQMLEDLVRFEHEFGYRRVPKTCRRNTVSIDLAAPEARAFLEAARGYRLFKAHSSLGPGALGGHVKFISVYRDPRDVVASNVFHLTSLGHRNGGFKPEMAARSTHDKVLRILDREYFLDRLEYWFRSDGVYQIRYEDAKGDSAGVLAGVVEHLGLEIDQERIREVAEWHSLRRRAARLRKGVAGDWVNHFDDRCRERFKVALDGRWNRLLVDMGYEDTPDW